MNKITKKLFFYFSIVSLAFSIVVFSGFCGILRYYMIEHHIEEMEETAMAVKKQLEWMYSEGTIEGRGAYIKYLNDVALAEVYVIPADGSSFTCGRNPDSEKRATKEVQEFADTIFGTGRYRQLRMEESDAVYTGVPVEENGEITAAVVLVDHVGIDRKSFILSVSVLFGCLSAAILFSGILSVFLAKRFMKPIQKIAFATKELAGGNYQIRTDVYDDNEIGILARETDILAQKLDYASKESERMNRMQKEYIANISHELRTPVAVLRGSVEALCDDVVPKDQIGDYEKQMLAETISLQRLVNDMLELSRLENEEFPIEKEEIDLLLVLTDAIRSVRVIAGEKKIQVHYEKIEEEWELEGDYGRLRQMFLIVLENAVKYSEEKTNVWVRAVKKSENYYISIEDEGCGIKEEEQEFIFDKFYRSSHRKAAGTGLGMAIAKKIADWHNISIRLHSVCGQGTKITFIVPANSKENSY